MSKLSQYELGILVSGMSPGSAGMMLGRSAAWIERTRQALAKITASDPGPEEILPPLQVAEPPVGQVLGPETATEERPRGKIHQPPATWSISPRKLQYCQRFLAAGWPLGEVADLFDVYPNELSAALAEAA